MAKIRYCLPAPRWKLSCCEWRADFQSAHATVTGDHSAPERTESPPSKYLMSTAPINNDVTGYILAGGKSRRMGIDKKWIKIGRDSLIERTYHLLTNTLGQPPIIVCNDTETVFPSTWEVIRDKVPGKGPLGGLVALLEHCRSAWASVLPVDLPYLTSEEINLLLASPRNDYEVITLSEAGDPEPLIALYSKSTLKFWTQRLNDSNLSLYKGIRKLKWKPVLIPIGCQALTNLNTPKDLNKLI